MFWNYQPSKCGEWIIGARLKTERNKETTPYISAQAEEIIALDYGARREYGDMWLDSGHILG